MNPLTRSTLLLSCAAALSAPLVAQYQAANETARRFGLVVRELETTSAIPDKLTVSGPPGSAYFVLLAIPVAQADVAFQNTAAPVGQPMAFDPLGIWSDVTGQLTSSISGLAAGIMPATGTDDLTFTMSLPVAPGTEFVWQILGLDPLNPTVLDPSNGVRKITQAPFVRPIFGPYTFDAPAIPAEDYIEVEQGDVDGDGDLDTVQITCGGTVRVFTSSTQDLALDLAPFQEILAGEAYAAELADFNNDNYLDLVLALAGPSMINGTVQIRAAVFLNLGRNPINQTELGPWLGFGPALPPATFAWDPAIGGYPSCTDVETADIDGDGSIDIFLGAALASDIGLTNRLLTNNFDAATATPVGFTEVTATNYLPAGFADDTEDVEFADLDNDGDMDIVVGNFDGPAGVIGEDFVYINQGGLQGGVLGVFVQAQILPGAPIDDETFDVLVADFNGDGAADIYVGNWYETFSNLGTASFTGATMRDRLYLTAGGVPLVWVDASAQLPDAPGHPQGIPAWPTTDAEAVDYDRDGVLDILVSAGDKCIATPSQFGTEPAVGMHFLRLLPGVGLYLDDILMELPAEVVPPSLNGMSDMVINDIEMGDWQFGRFWDLDAGLATGVNGASSGLFVLTK